MLPGVSTIVKHGPFPFQLPTPYDVFSVQLSIPEHTGKMQRLQKGVSLSKTFPRLDFPAPVSPRITSTGFGFGFVEFLS